MKAINKLHVLWETRKSARRAEISAALHKLDELMRKAVEDLRPYMVKTNSPDVGGVYGNAVKAVEDLSIDLPDKMIPDITQFLDLLNDLQCHIEFPVLPDHKSKSMAAKERGKLMSQLYDVARRIRSDIKKYLD